MESLINYESDEDNKENSNDADYGTNVKSIENSHELDVNYDPVEMDESDENNSCDKALPLTSVSPEDAPLVFRPANAPGSLSLDSRNSSDMEMDDNESDLDAEIKTVMEKGDFKNADATVSEEEPLSRTEDLPVIPPPAEILGNSSENMQESKATKLNTTFTYWETKSKYPKRPHSPGRNSENIDFSSDSCIEAMPQSAERQWKNPRIERETSVFNKYKFCEPDKSGYDTFLIKTNQRTADIPLPSYYNPAMMNASKYAQQVQKKQLLWGNKNNESKQKQTKLNIHHQWSTTTFKNDNDGKMTEKFKRLMGIKESPTDSCLQIEENNIIDKQNEMFSNMEAQYQVARMATHTHRGVGLGYTSQPNRTPIQKKS